MWIYRNAGWLALTALATMVMLGGPTARGAESDSLRVTVKKDSTAGGLNVSHPLLPGNTLAYLSCEGIVFGEPTQSTPLFEVKISDDPAAAGKHWNIKDGAYSYVWTYENGIKVDFSGIPSGTGLRLRYVLTNTSQTPLSRVILHTCIPTTAAPAFFPGLVESSVHEPGRTGNFMGFYDRTFLWSEGQRFSVGQTGKGREEIHLSFTRAGESPVEWGWWRNGSETFDFPFIAVRDKDGAFTTALGFEAAEWASCNGGDDRACFHLFPLFGDLKPGESRKVEGCFYLLRGTPENALDQFKKDFPEAGKGK